MFSFADVSFSALIFFEFLWNECTHQGHKSSNIGIYFQGSSKSLWIPYAILIAEGLDCKSLMAMPWWPRTSRFNKLEDQYLIVILYAYTYLFCLLLNLHLLVIVLFLLILVRNCFDLRGLLVYIYIYIHIVFCTLFLCSLSLYIYMHIYTRISTCH